MRDFHGVSAPARTLFRGEVVLGSTAELAMLSKSERDAVLVAARVAIPRDKAVIAGTGRNATLHTIRQTKRAASAGSRLGTPDGDGIEEIKESLASAGLP